MPVKLPTITPSAPWSQTDDQQHRRDDRDRDVREAREHEEARALLDPEDRGQLLVVHLRPDADEGGADEPRVVEAERVGDRPGEEDAGGEPEPSRSPS